ncbi:MAG: single-stranded DNA-binding protein [Phaeodactylibacter sp.]|nr:single-stranded DNA-binding protein [Phaeodactylibacter sp.]MCB9304413.1 single-stranded DNA-binding protein [Lewinellaceae bacterium]
MNNLRNKVQLIGNLGREVEFKELGDGNAIARVTIATKDIYKNAAGERVVDVQWHNLIGWGRVAEIMAVMLRKGREVAVQGKLTHRTFEDKDGQKRNISEVVVSEFIPLN